MGRMPVKSSVASAGRSTGRACTARRRELFKRLGVHIDPRRPALGLSIADQQIIEIAKAISLDARLLIMDEPTAALSGNEVARLFAVARSLRDEGRALVFISHRFDEVFALCDTVTVMRDGSYISTTRIAETTESQIVAKMVGREVGDLFPKTPATDRRRRPRRPGPRDRRRVPRRLVPGPVRRDRGARRTGRRRAQRDRACGLRRRRLRRRVGHPARQAGPAARPSRGDPCRHRVRPRGPPPAGPGPARLGRQEHRVGHPRWPRQGRVPHRRRGVQGRPAVGLPPRGQDQRTGHDGRHHERRQPAEGRHRQVAGHQPQAADHRRAHPRHRRRHQGRGAPAALRAGRPGPGDPDDLQRAARGPRDGRPRARRLRGPDHRRHRARRRHARERDGCCDPVRSRRRPHEHRPPHRAQPAVARLAHARQPAALPRALHRDRAGPHRAGRHR